MDADGLPLVGPGIDYTKVEAIEQKRLIAFLNHFVSHTAGFLNRFSCVCEEKLEHLSHRLQQIDITMSLLEAKIQSIPGMENITVASTGAASAGPVTAVDTQASSTKIATPGAMPPPTEPATQTSVPAPPPVEEQKADNLISKDPRFMRFFKMVQVGVPVSAVKMKMSAEGINPDLLDNPDAPAPAAQASTNNDEDDFSDDSEQSVDSDDLTNIEAHKH